MVNNHPLVLLKFYEVEMYYNHGMSLNKACRAAGISVHTYYRMRNSQKNSEETDDISRSAVPDDDSPSIHAERREHQTTESIQSAI